MRAANTSFNKGGVHHTPAHRKQHQGSIDSFADFVERGKPRQDWGDDLGEIQSALGVGGLNLRRKFDRGEEV